MNIPKYAQNWIEGRLPAELDQAKTEGRHCVYCDIDFEARGRKPKPVGDGDLRACNYCLQDLIIEARKERDRLAEEQRRRESANRIEAAMYADRYIDSARDLRLAARHIERLMDEGALGPLQLAYLMLELTAAKTDTDELRWKCVELDARQLYGDTCSWTASGLNRAVDRLQSEALDVLAYAVINAHEQPSPEFCAEQGCTDSCDGVHEIVEIDGRPDAVFESLERYGVRIRESAQKSDW